MKKVYLFLATFMTGLCLSVALHAETLHFDVTRDGSPIGHHIFTFSGDDNERHVDVSTRLKVKALFVTVFRYEHDRKEVWKKGKLVSLKSKTHNDGSDETLNVTREGHEFQMVNHKGIGQNIDATTTLPVTLWTSKITDLTSLFSALDGRNYQVAFEKVGTDTVSINYTKVHTTHYKMTGDLERDLWYDDQNRLVKVAFMKNGSKIIYIRK